MRTRSAAVSAILCLVALLVLSAAPPAQATHGDPSGPYGGSMRVSVQSAVSLNPFTATSADSWKVIPLVYDSLARIDPASLVPIPWAARSWSISGSTLSITLRSDLVFHDGSAVSAADVVYSYNQYKTAGLVPSDLTASGTATSVTLSSATGGGLLFGQGLTLPIVKSGSAANPIGSGPWRLQTSNATSWTLVANGGHFWPPLLETVTFSVYADTTAAARALLSGDLDFIGSTLGVDDPSALHNIGGVNRSLLNDATIVRNPGLQHLAFGFNMDPARPTSDLALRLALAMSIHPGLYNLINEGTSPPSRSPIIQEDVPWYNPNVPVYQVLTSAFPLSSAHLVEGLQALDTGGYLDRDADGIRDDTDGSPLALTAIGRAVTEDSRQFTVGFSTVDIWARLGLNVVLEAESSADLATRIAAGDFDVFVTRIDSELDPGFMRDLLHTDGGSNWVGYSNPTLDAHLNAADAALDPNARRTAVYDAQLVAMEDAVLLPAIHYNAVESTVRGGFDGWVGMPGGINNFWTYQMVHADQSLQADLTIVPNSVTSGQTTTGVVRVLDANGAPVASATVTFWIGGSQIASGVTDAAGALSQDIAAPAVSGATDVEVTARASKLGFSDASASAHMTVTPEVRPLIVAVSSSSVTVPSGDDVTITVTVRSGTPAVAVAGAEVSLRVIGLGGSLTVARGTTNAQGQLTSVFSADVGPRTQFRIVASASASDYQDGEGSTTVVVEQHVGMIEPRVTPGLDIGTIAVAVIALAVIAALAAFMGRKR